MAMGMATYRETGHTRAQHTHAHTHTVLCASMDGARKGQCTIQWAGQPGLHLLEWQCSRM